MRYYEVYLPGKKEPAITSNVRTLHDLPDGTRIHVIITDRDGSLSETYEIPVQDGRAVVGGRGKQRPRMTGGGR